MTTGTTTIDFGSKATDATVAVTGQGSILTGSYVEAWLRPTATATNTADDTWVDEIRVVAGNIVAGTGFTVYARCDTGMARGQHTVAWVWT